MKNDKKKASRDKSRLEECNGFELTENYSYEDVDNETNTNFLVDKINYMTEKMNRKITEEDKKERKDDIRNSNVARASGGKTNGLVPADEHDASTDMSNIQMT